jgi:hypothetical protein
VLVDALSWSSGIDLGHICFFVSELPQSRSVGLVPVASATAPYLPYTLAWPIRRVEEAVHSAVVQLCGGGGGESAPVSG